MKVVSKYFMSTIIISIFILFGGSIIHFVAAQSGGNKSGIFSTDSKPYGLTYGEWTAKWWTWIMTIPKNLSPADDNTGARCPQGQNGPVWFLAGSLTGKADRTCTIPAGKAILFPILNSECSYAEFPKLKTESDLRKCAVSEVNQVTHVEATVDGVPLQKSQILRIQSPMFNFSFPDNNIFGAPKGPTSAVGDGFWVFLQPLSPGKHDIAFKGVQIQFTTTGTVNQAQVIGYHLIQSPTP
jgi:hypothetical protein